MARTAAKAARAGSGIRRRIGGAGRLRPARRAVNAGGRVLLAGFATHRITWSPASDAGRARQRERSIALDFELSEEQALLRRPGREFAERELAPHSRDWDERQEFPREVFARLASLGLTGVCWPEDYGGSGLSLLDWAIVMEELARAGGGVALWLAPGPRGGA